MNDQKTRDLRVIRQALVILVALVLGAACLYGIDQYKHATAKQNACMDYLTGDGFTGNERACH